MRFVMGCKRDSFAPEHKFTVEIDTTGVPANAYIPYTFGGASVRVKLQGWMRNKWTEAQFIEKSKETLKLHFNDIIKGMEVPLKDRIAALEKDDFVELMMDEYGMEEEQAVALYNKKHGIETE